MKRSFKSALGVTLLEIMLVLAIAAMVVVMSIRYYQSASINQKVAATMNNVTGIIAAAESIFTTTGSVSTISSTAVAAYLPGNTMPLTGWSTAITISGTSANQYKITIKTIPKAACMQLINLMKQNSKLVPGTCSADPGDLTVDVTI